MEGFSRSLAFLVAIDGYGSGLPVLRTPVSDAEGLAKVLREEHGFETEVIANENATARRLRSFLKKLPSRVGSDDRVIFYFAGHGIALESDEGPKGFILPHDASRDTRRNLLAMADLDKALAALPCRHMLVVLDCCFAGAFRWGSFRHVVPAAGNLHKERYQWFIEDAAWQAIASAAHDQKALDVAGGQPLGKRDDAREHSPFAAALIRGLKGAADQASVGSSGDGVITATELYLYLESELLPKRSGGFRQTPIFWPLKKHDKGQFVFLVPGRALALPNAPLLDADANPWRGLEPYEARHAELFFGRGEVSKKLVERVVGERFVVVTGPSGVGKSSLVKAGLLPRLKDEPRLEDKPLESIVVRPGPAPFASLARALKDAIPVGVSVPDETALKSDPHALSAWVKSRSGQGEVLLVVDQAEELITMSRDDAVMKSYLTLIANGLDEGEGHLRVVFTVRSEFEPQFAQSPLKARWSQARFLVPPMTQDELRRVIEGPAAVKVMRFEPGGLVEDLVNEVVQMPGALPLLSFALSQMYTNYLKRRSDDRALTNADYKALEGGVTGSLRVRANELVGVWDEAHETTARRVLERLLSMEAGHGLLADELDVKDPVEDARAERVLSRMEDASLIVRRQENEQSLLQLTEGATSPTLNDLLARVKQAFDSYQETARRVLERFVSVDVGEFARRRVSRQEFEVAAPAEQARVDKILERLDEARLVVTDKVDDKPYLELAHDALILGWDRLLNWVRQDAPLIADLRRLTPDAEIWVKAPKQQTGRLWSDPARLDAVKKLQAAAAPGLNKTEAEFGQASVTRARRNRFIRWSATAALIILAILTSVGFIIARRETSRAEQQTQIATAQSDRATANESRALTALSAVALNRGHPNDAAKLALAAWPREADAASPPPRLDTLSALSQALSEGKLNDDYFSSAEVIVGGLITSDKSKILIRTKDDVVRVLDVLTGKQIGKSVSVARLGPVPENIGVITIGNGQMVLSWKDNVITVWDVATGQAIGRKMIQADRAVIIGGWVTPDEKLLATWAAGGDVTVWNLSTREKVGRPITHVAARGAIIDRVRGRLVSWSENAEVRIWDLASGQQVGKTMVHGDAVHGRVYGVLLSDDGRRILSWAQEGKVRLWEAYTGEQIGPAIEATWTQGAVLLNDKSEIVGLNFDVAERWSDVWGTPKKGLPIATSHLGWFSGVALHPRLNRALLWSGGDLRLYDLSDGGQIGPPLKTTDDRILGADFSADGSRAVAWTESGIETWSLTTGQQVGQEFNASGATFNGDDTKLLLWVRNKLQFSDGVAWKAMTNSDEGISSYFDGAFFDENDAMAYAWDFFNIMAFDLNTGERIYKRNTNGFVQRILPLRSPKAIVVGDLSIWDLKLGQPSEPALQHDGHEGVAVSGDRTKIVTWSRNGEVRLWNADAQSQLGGSMLTGNWITGALFNKRGDSLIVWSSNELSIWDVKTQARIGDALPFRDIVSQVRLIGNERLAVLTGQRIELWDIASRQRAGSPITVPSGAADFAVMPDASHIVTWGVGSKIRIWDLASRQQMGNAPGAPGLLGAQLTKDGKKILWWNSEKVFLWPLDWAGDGNLIDFACRALADQGVDVIKNRYGVAVEPICTHSWSMVPESYWDQLGN